MGKYQQEKMKKCKHCQSDIPYKAKVCPQCRKKVKGGKLKWIIIGIIAVALITSFGNEPESQETVQIDTPQNMITDTTSSVELISESVPEVTETEAPSLTMAQKNALNSAKAYLTFSAFSYEGLIGQLEFEQYSHEDAVYAADNCGADWFEQALKSAENYLNFSAFSHEGLIEQLEYEKFTTEQATYAADNCDADWFEQAAKSAENYLSFSSFSRSGLIDQLLYEGFTQEQAEYGVTQNGY